jgi:c-di-GMP-binding flagellar brake protein YcgR
MAVLQELKTPQINELLSLAVEKMTPVIITVRSDTSWAILHSRALAIEDQHLLLEMPLNDATAPPHEFVPAERLGINFKLRHHKHIFAATVAGQQQLLLAGEKVPALAVVMPTRMQRLQRRAFLRADVPPNRIVRASFWLGGCEVEPDGGSPDLPVWSGTVTNISAGGFQLSTDQPAADGMESGDIVGVRMVFGAGDETIYADAQYRHAGFEGGKALIGFQFIGLTETPKGRAVMQMISSKVIEFQKISERMGSSARN